MLLAFILASVTGGVLIAGLTVPLVTAAGTVSNASTEIFTDLPPELEIAPPSEKSTMYAADGSVMTDFYADLRVAVPSEEISEHIKNATVALEDRRFFDHNGIDPTGLMRAFVSNAASGTSQGASTLTQQYIKNVRIEEGRVADDPVMIAEATKQTYGRKLEEARFAIALEKVYTKDEILTGYLNLAQYGVSVYGVEAASQHYFSKPASEVTISEAALLASIPQAPGRWDPEKNPEDAQDRRDKTLRDMRSEGYITEEEYDEAVAVDVGDMLNISNTRHGCDATGNMAYFCQYVVSEVLNNETFGETQDERRQLLLRGGLQIHTTIDPDRQKAAFDAVTASVPINDPSGVKIGLAAVEPGTGRIQAMAQNTNYGKPTEDDPSRTEMNFNVGRSHGGGEGFQTGSTFKAIVLAQWLKDGDGNSLHSVVRGNRPLYPANSWNISCEPGNAADYTPKNLESVAGDMVTVLDATRRSVNLPFVEMANQMDLCALAGTAKAMGLKKGNGDDLEIRPSMVLGSNTIAGLDMANAFATFANEGVYCSPIAIERVIDRDGNDLEVPQSECERALDKEVAAGVNYALQQVTRSGGTGSLANMGGRPVAGKTGTANNNYYAWFVGYTPQLAAAVWMGHSEANISMSYVTVNGRWHRWIYGGAVPAPTWRTFMQQAMDGEPVEGFARPTEKTIYGERRAVPSVVGLSVEQAEQALSDAQFTIRVGDEVYSDQPAGSIAGQTPGSGSMQRPGSVVSVTISRGPEPEPEEEDDDEDESSESSPGRGDD